MQRPIIILFLFLFSFLIQVLDSKAQSIFTAKADSLFNEKKYSEATILYEDLLSKHDINRSNAFLKLSYIHEQKGDFSQAIYFLSEYFQLKPSEKVFDKISKMADENSFSGYSRSDLNFFLLLYQQYFIWMVIILLAWTIYSFWILFRKRQLKQFIATRYKISFVFFVFLVFVIINFPSLYSHGIVKKESIHLRSEPSSAAELSSNLLRGSRVNIIGQKDIWLKLYLNGKVQYAKRSDFWVIGKESM